MEYASAVANITRQTGAPVDGAVTRTRACSKRTRGRSVGKSKVDALRERELERDRSLANFDLVAERVANSEVCYAFGNYAAAGVRARDPHREQGLCGGASCLER